MRIALEFGPKGKKVVAVAEEWPGLSRGDRTEDQAVERLLAYVPRYAPVAELAGLASSFPQGAPEVEVAERYEGTGSTDFWGISFGHSSFDRQPISAEELDRELSLLRASWAFFDGVRTRVSPELRKGPRGGGRDRDQIVRHTFAAELDMARTLGLRPPLEELLTPDGLRSYRAAYEAAIRDFHAEEKPFRKWPIRFLVRHTAYHTLDHAWEMEDKDLTATRAPPLSTANGERK
jgi:hypothetical protein